jgi:FkbM family methyltransferase
MMPNASTTSSETNQARYALTAKRTMRALWCRIPRSSVSYNVGKLLLRTLLPPSGHPEWISTQFGGRIPMQLDLGDHVGNDLFCLDTHYESTTLDLWRRLSSRAATIVDIGSHIGTYSLVAAEANPHAQILAIEADTDNFAILQKHCRNYPMVRPINAAVSHTGGSMWFCHNDPNSGAGSLKPAPVEGQRCHLIQTQSLESVCVDNHMHTIDLMKVDVEGYEHALLIEGAHFWERYKPAHVIAEIYQEFGRAIDGALFRAMQQRGYLAERVQGLIVSRIGRRTDLANWHFWRG